MAEAIDLFLDSMVNVPLRDDRALMEHPFFSLTKNPRFDPIEYSAPEQGVKIRITAGEKGIATIWDKDILIYVTSLLNDRLERGLPLSRTLTFAAYDLLRVTGRNTGKSDYEKLYDALFRLRSTTIETTITADDAADRRGFGWIESWRIEERTTATGQRVMAAVQLTLNDWMFRAIVKDRRVLSINRRYFQITMGIERRLYELARKHCGNQKEWLISLTRLAEKCGTVRELRKFKADLKKIIERNTTPEYCFELMRDPTGSLAKGLAKDGYNLRGRLTNERVLVRITPRLINHVDM